MGPRLLYVVNDAAFFVSHRLALGRRGLALGLDVTVAAPEGPGRAAIEASGLRFVPIPLDRASAEPVGEVRTLAALVRLFRRERPSLVHAVTIKPVLYGGIAAQVTGVPALVSSISGMGYVFIAEGRRAMARRAAVRAMYRLALRHPRSRVVFQNAADRDALVEGGMVPAADAVVVPGGSGVELGRFDPAPPTTPPLVVLPARMLRDKGVVEFAEAARGLREAGSTARFVLAGGLDRRNPAALNEVELRELVARTGVEWWGHQADMPEVLRQAHIVCLPSYREGTPKALLEAAAAGRPVVTTDVPGCRDAIRVGETGLVVPVRDARSLQRVLGELLADPVRARTLGRAGRTFAEQELGVDRVVDAIYEVYRMVAPPELVVALRQRTAS